LYRFFLWRQEAQRKKLAPFGRFAKKKRRGESFALCGARQAPFLKESVLDTKEFYLGHSEHRLIYKSKFKNDNRKGRISALFRKYR